MFFVGVPKLVIIAVVGFFLFGVPLMAYLATICQRKNREESNRKGDSR